MIIKLLEWYPPHKNCYGYTGLPYRLLLMQCDFCGKEFESDNERRKYCCENCTNQAGIKNRKEKNAQARKRKCQVCGETFIPPRNDAKFCSDKCKQSAYRTRLKANVIADLIESGVMDIRGDRWFLRK